jgi:hypothetical protein
LQFHFSDLFESPYNCSTIREKHRNVLCSQPTIANFGYIIAYTAVIMILVVLFDFCLPRTGQPSKKRWFGRKKDALNVDVSAWDSGRFSSVLPDTDRNLYFIQNLTFFS